MDGYNVIERFDGQHALASLCRHQAISSVPCAVRIRTGWLKQHRIFRKCAIEPLWAACRDCWLHSTMASLLLVQRSLRAEQEAQQWPRIPANL